MNHAANDRLGAIRTLCRILSGLTIAEAIDHLTCIDMALRGQVDLPPDDARLAGMMAILTPWGPEWGCDILEWTHDLILDGHHVNAHSGRMVWMLEVRDALAGGRKCPSPLTLSPAGEREHAEQPGPRFRGDDRISPSPVSLSPTGERGNKAQSAHSHAFSCGKDGIPAWKCASCGLLFSYPNALHLCEPTRPGLASRGDDSGCGGRR